MSQLSMVHSAELVEGSGISQGIIETRGYRTIRDKTELLALGFADYQASVPALLLPGYRPDGSPGTPQIKPDNPRYDKDGKLVKYESLHGVSPTIDALQCALVRDAIADPKQPLVIVEGKKKADSAISRGIACLALDGVFGFCHTNEFGGKIVTADLLNIAWNGRKVYIAFDSDIMEKCGVRLALYRLTAVLEAREAEVNALFIPDGVNGAKVGLDDYFVAGGKWADLLKTAQPVTEDMKIAAELAELNQTYAALTYGQGKLIQEDGDGDFTMISQADLYLQLKNRPNALAERWLTNAGRREYRRVVFAPGSGDPRDYNAWKGFAVSPDERGEDGCAHYLKHLRDVVADGDEIMANYLIQYMAHAVQRPGEIPKACVVLQSETKGTGKSMAVGYFGDIFGRHYKVLAHRKHLTGNFNAHLGDALVVLAEEALWAGNKEDENHLKSLITESEIFIEKKGVDAIKSLNYMRVFMATNNRWVVPASEDERRFAIYNPTTAPRPIPLTSFST